MSGARMQPGLAFFLAALMTVITGCAHMERVPRNNDEGALVIGPAVSENRTPLESAFDCLSQRIYQAVNNHHVLYRHGNNIRALRIGVGQVKDYSGKFSELNGGSAITQGGTLMVISALGKLDGAVRIFERFDTGVTDLELQYLAKRYLGDETKHRIQDKGKTQEVPWKPYLGGTLVETDYFIVGGITEVNYNIYSGGAELLIDQIGPRARIFAINVSIDLRLVDTDSLEIVKTISMQKQVLGYEVEASIFRFFDNNLVDFNAGVKNQEPLQLAVRTTLEQGVLDLMAYATGTSLDGCPGYDANDLRVTAGPVPAAVAPTPVTDADSGVAEPVVPIEPEGLPSTSQGSNSVNGRYAPQPRGIGPDASKRPTDPKLAQPPVTGRP